MMLPDPTPETKNAVHCAAFYVATTVPPHRIFHDMHSYWRIAHANETQPEEVFKALTIYEMLKEAHEMAQQRARGEL